MGDKRIDKNLQKMRTTLQSAFGDGLKDFRIPVAVRSLSQDLEIENTKLEDRLRQVSSLSDEVAGENPQMVDRYLEEREELVADIATYVKEASKIARAAESAATDNKSKKALKRALDEINTAENRLLKERAAIAADRIRVKYNMHGQPSQVRLGEAYMMAISHHLPEPSGHAYDSKHKRDKTTQTSFRRRLISTYCSNASELRADENLDATKMWCPVSKGWHYSLVMTAAHIFPQSIGESNAAYLFGMKMDQGHEAIWSEKNGLMLHKSVEKLLDAGEMVIVPDPEDNNEFISIILTPELLGDDMERAFGRKYKELHHSRLEFQTEARPGKRYLYMQTMMTVFRRRRYGVSGWENDQGKVFDGKIWATPRKWARKSMVAALALEVGDSWETLEAVDGLGEFPNAISPQDEERLATVMRYGLEFNAKRHKEFEDGDEDADEDEY